MNASLSRVAQCLRPAAAASNSLSIVALLAMFFGGGATISKAQALNTATWPAGTSIGSCTIGYLPLGAPLDILHLHGFNAGPWTADPNYANPALRISYGQSQVRWGTLSLESGNIRRSTISQLGDFELAGAWTSQDVIIASLNGGESLTTPGTFDRMAGSIRFTTTPHGAGAGGVNADIERMTIWDSGKVAIGTHGVRPNSIPGPGFQTGWQVGENDLLHLHVPCLNYSYTPDPQFGYDAHQIATLKISYGALPYGMGLQWSELGFDRGEQLSAFSNDEDLVLSTNSNQNGYAWGTGDIIITNRRENQYIRFGTTFPGDNAPNNTDIDQERMTISPVGNVGIAQHAPTERLDVNGNIRLEGNDNGARLGRSLYTGSATQKLNLYSNSVYSDSRDWMELFGPYDANRLGEFAISGTYLTLWAGNDGTGNMNGYGNNEQQIAIKVAANGNVGIGTNLSTGDMSYNPAAKLELNSGSAGIAGLRFWQLTSTSAVATNPGVALSVDANGNVILVNPSSGPSGGWGLTGNTGTNSASNFAGTTDAQDFVLKSDGIEQLRLIAPTTALPAGAVVVGGPLQGTGTLPTPSGTLNLKLLVNGSMVAKEIWTSTAWSDFVFDENYKLPSLQSVVDSIQATGHLPGIPSAQDVAVHGIAVGTMEAKLLQKIEELALYIEQQNKRIQKLEAEMSNKK